MDYNFITERIPELKHKCSKDLWEDGKNIYDVVDDVWSKMQEVIGVMNRAFGELDIHIATNDTAALEALSNGKTALDFAAKAKTATNDAIEVTKSATETVDIINATAEEVVKNMDIMEKSNFDVTIESPYVIISNDNDVDADVPVDTNIIIKDREGNDVPIIQDGNEADGVVVKYTCVGCYFDVRVGKNNRGGILEGNHFHKDAVYVAGNTSRIDFEAVRYANGEIAGIQRQSIYIIKTEFENPLLTKYGEPIVTKNGLRINVLTASYK